MDLFLKFNSEEEAIQYLYDVIPSETNEEGEVIKQTELRPKFKNIDTIGFMYKKTGETEEQKVGDDVIEVPVMEQVDGWHVNVRVVTGENYSSLQKFSITPKAPQRVWA